MNRHETVGSIVRAHKLLDYKLAGWHEEIAGRWHYRDLVANSDWYNNWISFDCLCWDRRRQTLFCGLNNLNGDLLYRFDPCTGVFSSCGTQAWADTFDSKIHRGLLQNPVDRKLYFGTSLLHDVDQQHEAPGGKLVRYDPDENVYDVLGIPEPHLYLQSIAADWHRQILYAFTYPAEFLVRFDLATGVSRRLAYVGNAINFCQPHNAVVDAEGRLWGTCGETRAWDEMPGSQPIRLFCYQPDHGRFTWFDRGLSRKTDRQQLIPDLPESPDDQAIVSPTRHKEDYGFCDGMVYDGARYIYAGTVAGVLCRIDTHDGSVRKVANVCAAGRLPALALHNGVLYAAGGVKGHTRMIRWNVGSQQMESFGVLVDPETGERPARIHDIAITDAGGIYLAENDHHSRSSYLWSVMPAAT